MPRLDIHLGGRRIIECPVQGEVIMGRGPEATVVLPAPGISRIHARIRPANSGYELVDQSVNGTLLNGSDVEGAAPLADGASIGIGPYRIIFSLAPAGPAGPTSVARALPTRLLRATPEQITCVAARLELLGKARGPVSAVFPLPDRAIAVGKSPDCDIVLADEFVSRLHARLVPVPGGWRIEDLGSRNGTRINGRETGAALLADGDRIQIGNLRFLFRQELQAGDMGGTEDAGAELMRGETPAIVQLRRLAARIAPSNATVLVLGETGTGKEVYARLVHMLSARAGQPFIAVNCGAIPEALFESELFGHEPGAFTGAIKRNPGLFAAAAAGTLFLDEIADLPVHCQVKLLRALESGTVRPVGSTTDIPAAPRIIAATSADLTARLREGCFREDLFHRINVIPVRMPPLRERKSDLPLLAASFLDGGRSLSPEALDKLRQHDWPGNIRELRNTVERAAVISDGPAIGPDAVFTGSTADAAASGGYLASRPEFQGKTLDEIEREILRRVLADMGGVQAKAARALGISRGSLHGKLVRHGLIQVDGTD
ncbi:MAG: sigma 54-interacting transcriptional regulator [Deltaproteobacteria bacterium]|nr:sigma 54-interacting transcriptional regulator [Deltaproteobacteria bacterium]